MLTEHLITFFVRFESLSETSVESSSSESSTNREISALEPASVADDTAILVQVLCSVRMRYLELRHTS